MHHDAGFSARCGEQGFLGLTLPTEFGGHGRSALERYVVCEEMLAAGAPVGSHWIADRQSGPQIARHGSLAMKRKVLPLITAGRCCFGIGMSEPDAGSDLASVRTRAERTTRGWRITGTKLWTSNAHRAQYVIVLARTAAPEKDRHAGLTQFVVDMTLPGVKANPFADLTGARDFCEVVFDGVEVDDDAVLGMPGEGWRLVTGELAYERSGPDRFLSTFPLLVDAVNDLRSDVDWHTRSEIGRIVSQLYALRQMSSGIAGMLDRGESPGVEAALAKDVGTALEQEIPETVRTLYQRGTTQGDKRRAPALLPMATLAARAFTLRGGTREILRGIVARELGLR
jgi:alkylation response protein AidB-like acyl-CoA dehydrogenase